MRLPIAIATAMVSCCRAVPWLQAWLYSIKPNNPDKVEIAPKYNGISGGWRAYVPHWLSAMLTDGATFNCYVLLSRWHHSKSSASLLAQQARAPHPPHSQSLHGVRACVWCVSVKVLCGQPELSDVLRRRARHVLPQQRRLLDSSRARLPPTSCRRVRQHFDALRII